MLHKDLKNREEFENWLGSNQILIDNIFEALPEDVAIRLDYSIESLDAVESWLLATYPSMEDIRDDYESILLDGISRYVGEVFIQHVQGYWEIDLSDEDNVFFARPIIRSNEVKLGTDVYPASLVTASVKRRKGNFISTILRNILRRNLTA